MCAFVNASSATLDGRTLSKPIVLIGLMGVGKTSIGKRLAQTLQLPFADADDEIALAAGQDIAGIFESLGEAAFRDGEQRVIARLLDDKVKVLATGGGAVLSDKTRALFKDRATTIWLKCAPEILARRVAKRNHRPLLKGKDPLAILSEQMQRRYPLYEQADICVETGDGSHAQTVELVLESLKHHLSGAQ